MSHKSTPRSPRSKSPSCQEEDEPEEAGTSPRGRVIDEMRRQLEEELESSERLLSATNSLMAEAKGSRNYSRPPSTQAGSRSYNVSYEGSRSRNSSPLKSSRPPSGLDQDPLRLPSPPRSPSAYGSRGVSSGMSQRGTRVPTPEYSNPRSGSPYPVKSTQVDDMCDCEDALVGPDETFYKEIATSYASRDWSSRGRSGMNGGESNMSYVNMDSSRDPSPGNSSMRGQATNPPSRETFTLASATGYSNCTGGPSRLTCATPRGESHVEAGNLVPGPSAKFNYLEEEHSGNMCRPGCRRHLDVVDRSASALKMESSKASLAFKNPPIGPSDGLRARLGQSAWSQRDHQVHQGDRGISFARGQGGNEGFTKGPQGSSGHGHHHHHHHDGGLDEMLKRDERATAALAHLSQLKKTPSYFMCGVNQGVEFMSVCCPKGGKLKLPEMPCLQQEELNELLKCEKQDVESAYYLASDERKTYKKPCPKQQKAQMNVKALVKAHANQTCGVEKYTPLDHPDPEDISPEVAATMMFSQEQGIKMDACPRDTISHLFPDELKPPFPEKVPRSSISIVDPNQKDRDEMMEKSASVPYEGVSDSAYTRTMKEKGEDLGAQKSYDVDFAIGQSKREYVLVAQKPQRFSKVQFRGGSLPSWFPGYFSAFPDEDGGMKSISSPSGLFHKAWVHTNPRNMPTNDVIVLD